MDSKFQSKSRLSILLTLILGLLLINNLRSVLNYKNGLERLRNAQVDLENLQAENAQLQETKAYVQSDEYLEKTALENLNLTKQENTILVITESLDNQSAGEIIESVPNNSTNQKTNVDMWISALNLRN